MATPKPRLADFPCELLLKELERRRAVISCDCGATGRTKCYGPREYSFCGQNLPLSRVWTSVWK